MEPLSATDAIGNAFTHTRTVLAPRPFRLGRFYKLALTAALTQASFLSVSFVYPLQGAQLAAFSSLHRFGANRFAGNPAATALGLGVLLLLMVAMLAFGLGVLYLICRLRVTLFDLVVVRGGHVRQAWRRHGRAAWRYLGLHLLAMLAWFTILAAILGPFLVAFIRTAVQQASRGAAPGSLSAGMTSQLFTIIALAWLLAPVWLAIDALLQDFLLPVLALEQAAPLRAALARLGEVARRSPGQLVLFLLLRTVVALGIGLALGMIALIAIGLLAFAAYGLGHALYNALWSGGLGAHTVLFTAIAAMVLVIGALYLLALVAIYGVTGVFKTSYAAYFYAGYYPELAIRLQGERPDDEARVGSSLPYPPPNMPPSKARADLPPELW